jgi:hypothetical protein
MYGQESIQLLFDAMLLLTAKSKQINNFRWLASDKIFRPFTSWWAFLPGVNLFSYQSNSTCICRSERSNNLNILVTDQL